MDFIKGAKIDVIFQSRKCFQRKSPKQPHAATGYPFGIPGKPTKYFHFVME
jgi:hypothetical protein